MFCTASSISIIIWIFTHADYAYFYLYSMLLIIIKTCHSPQCVFIHLICFWASLCILFWRIPANLTVIFVYIVGSNWDWVVEFLFLALLATWLIAIFHLLCRQSSKCSSKCYSVFTRLKVVKIEKWWKCTLDYYLHSSYQLLSFFFGSFMTIAKTSIQWELVGFTLHLQSVKSFMRNA